MLSDEQNGKKRTMNRKQILLINSIMWKYQSIHTWIVIVRLHTSRKTRAKIKKWNKTCEGNHLPFILHSFTWRSSAPETISGNEGWNEAQLTPRSWPSKTYFTTASTPPNRSAFIWVRRRMSSAGDTVFFLRAPISQTRTVWSSDADTTKSSLGWKDAHMT